MKLTKEGIAVIEGDNYLSAQIEREGRLDVCREQLLQYRQHIPEGGVVVDAGASLGDTAATFSEFVGPLGMVHAFEPNPDTYECLLYNIQYYKHGFENVTPHMSALGNALVHVGMVIDHNNIGASRLVWTERPDVTNISVVSLDWLLQLERLDFFKIDTEGCEPWVLDGARETIMRCRPAILIEVNTWPLGKLGFTPQDIWSRLDSLNYVYEKFDGPYGDVLCLPREQWIQP